MKKVGSLLIGILLLASLAGISCAKQTTPVETVPLDSGRATLSITSTAFAGGADIPVKYTCQGQNISPELSWSGAPDGTASFALIMDDPDAVYTHWVIYNLPADSNGLPEAVPKDEQLANGALQGKIGSGGIGYPTGYFGPCPPKGPAHHYRFTLYALDTSLNLAPGASKAQLLQAIEGHIIGQGQLVGLYQNQ